MAVWTYALTTVAEVLAFLGADVQRNAFWAYFTGTTGTNTIQINDNSVVLVDEDNLTTTFDTTVATGTYDTLTELVLGINAVAGWEAGLIYHGSALSVDLIITGALDAEGVANKQTLRIQDVYLIERFIDRTTDFIERYCDRKLVSRTYTREVYFGSGFDRLFLEQYPVTRVIRLSSGRSNSFSILNTSTDANFCTVEVTSTTLRLVVDGGANDDDTALTLATYTTIDLLIAAIVALGKGWACTTLATDTGTRDASELLIRPSMAVTSVAQAYVETVDDDVTEYKLLYSDEDRNYGIIQRPGIFSPTMEYFVDYVAGFTTIPYALEGACIEYVKYKYDKSKRDSGVKSETIGKVYSYENFSMADFEKWLGLHPEIRAPLDLFRRREF